MSVDGIYFSILQEPQELVVVEWNHSYNMYGNDRVFIYDSIPVDTIEPHNEDMDVVLILLRHESWG